MAVGAAKTVAAGYVSAAATTAFERALELCGGNESKAERSEVLSGRKLNYLSRKAAKARELGEQLVTIAQQTRQRQPRDCIYAAGQRAAVAGRIRTCA